MNGYPNPYRLEWELQGEGIQFTVTVASVNRGWLGFGISTDGSMNSLRQISDIAVMWMNPESGNGFIVDYNVDVHDLPSKDANQNYDLVSADYENGNTIVTFYRLLDTQDAPYDRAIDPMAMTNFIWAMADNIPLADDGLKYGKHFIAGNLAINVSEVAGCSEYPPTEVASSYVTPDGTWSVEWTLVSGVSDVPDLITFEVSCQITSGWFAMGINEFF